MQNCYYRLFRGIVKRGIICNNDMYSRVGKGVRMDGSCDRFVQKVGLFQICP